MHNIAVVLLAAGNSSRLGTPKQLLNFKGKPLLINAVEEALKFSLHVIVVTGSNADLITPLLEEYDVVVCDNKKWSEGMSTGIVAGIHKALETDQNIDTIIISVCDQPYVSASLFRQILQVKNQSDKNIVACTYSDTIGVPVLFTKKYFNDLVSLKGDEGAKKLVKNFMDDVALVDFPQGAIDIDTADDYKKLIS